LSPISEALPTCSQKHSKVFQICLKKPIRPKSCDTKKKKKTKQNKTKTMNERCLKVVTSIPTFALVDVTLLVSKEERNVSKLL
jgi:hypothetical protein